MSREREKRQRQRGRRRLSIRSLRRTRPKRAPRHQQKTRCLGIYQISRATPTQTPKQTRKEAPRWRRWRIPLSTRRTRLSRLALRPAPSLATGIGEIRQTPLDDGSSVVLDTATRVTPRFSAAARDIRLDRGRALFRVAHDPARPFVVEAAGIRIRAVGTAFSVAQDDDVEVLVTEGVVEVTGALRPARLRAGERGRFRVGDAAATDLLSADAMARALDWRDGRLELQGQTLASAVAAINRYNRRPIVVADAALARQPLHGAFRNDDPEGFARTVALALGTRSRVENDRIVIGR